MDFFAAGFFEPAGIVFTGAGLCSVVAGFWDIAGVLASAALLERVDADWEGRVIAEACVAVCSFGFFAKSGGGFFFT